MNNSESEWVKVRLYAVDTFRGWVSIKTVAGEKLEGWTNDGFIATLFNSIEADEKIKKYGGKKVYRETREYAKDHPLVMGSAANIKERVTTIGNEWYFDASANPSSDYPSLYDRLKSAGLLALTINKDPT